jgi:hypothetical protein
MHVAAMATPRLNRPYGTSSAIDADYPTDESLGYFRSVPPGHTEMGETPDNPSVA